MTGADAARLQIVESHFETIGGRFLTEVADIVTRLEQCRALVFDWDGVWNAGRKGGPAASDFSEADSMGLNMLRYGIWRRTGEIPFTCIISGENNETAKEFAVREHLHDVYTGIADKRRVIEYICDRDGLLPDQFVCVFDDINDLGMAATGGLRLMAGRSASPLLADYVERRSLCDYVTGSSEHKVRECAELILGLLGTFDETLDSRVAFDDRYRRYLAARQAIDTRFLRMEGTAIKALES